MKSPSIPVALAVSLFAGFAIAGQTMLPMAKPSPADVPVESHGDAGNLQLAQSRRETYREQSGRAERRPEAPIRRENRRKWDCHRDVRTHWLGGAKVTHRHVGENCDVRVVRESTTSQ